jgi:hypothetical protein
MGSLKVIQYQRKSLYLSECADFQAIRVHIHTAPVIETCGRRKELGNSLKAYLLFRRHDAATANRAAANTAAVPVRAAAGAAQCDGQPGPDGLAAATWRGRGR